MVPKEKTDEENTDSDTLHLRWSCVTLGVMGKPLSPVSLKEIRLLGIGRLTAFTDSTADHPGFLIGSSKGLYHLTRPDAAPHRVRKFPIVYVISDESGVVCYEEVKGHGRIVVLDNRLEEVRVDEDLARTLNPVALYKGKVITFQRAQFSYFDPVTCERKHLANFVPVQSMTPIAKVAGGYEFFASYREPDWPTFLHKLEIPENNDDEGKVEVLAKAEDPVISRHFLRLSGIYYLVIPPGRPVFLIYKMFPGSESGIRTWILVPVPGGVRPAGLVKWQKSLYAACSDSLCTFELSDELGLDEDATRKVML
jgi:hypothetical protein